jgi:mono/diheme cytochrome c family protein
MRLLILLAFIPASSVPAQEAQSKKLIGSLEGADLFHAYCASCHGKEGKGDGPAAGALKRSPPDLTLIAHRGRGRFPKEAVERTIGGEDGKTAHGSREMPVWGPVFGQVAWDQDLGRVRLRNLVEFIEGIQRKKK